MLDDPAINGKGFAGHKPGLIARQEERHISYVFRRPVALERGVAGQEVADILLAD